jgi:uncharacterized membrane protein YphA (DoxX/SURF4 family)
MKLLSELIKWFEKHNNLAYSFIRIFLGIALLIRGLILSSDPQTITQWIGANQWYWWYSYIIVIHIIGGFLLAIGFSSRLAALLQIPVLIGAVFFIHLKQGLMRVEQSLELSVLVLILLIIFVIFGSGDLSVDNYIAKKKSKA